ncbi:hypothetical protein CDEST_07455 [Colletotrichum destructivum]|uniref:Ankyrin repeat protein n=1 Tax=Colletotrichum destructivum TaxID=34406 RepID=A0AAX4IH84_9PEZI|nr:hypothetical protein CDEST_07455 [Colletotrichum destructivum]
MFEHMTPPRLGNVEIQDTTSDGMPIYQIPTEHSRLPNDDSSSQSVQEAMLTSQPGSVMKPTENKSDCQTPSAVDEEDEVSPRKLKYDDNQDLPYYFESDGDENHQRDMLTKLLEAGANPSNLDFNGISPPHSVLNQDEDFYQFRGSGNNPTGRNTASKLWLCLEQT